MDKMAIRLDKLTLCIWLVTCHGLICVLRNRLPLIACKKELVKILPLPDRTLHCHLPAVETSPRNTLGKAGSDGECC